MFMIGVGFTVMGRPTSVGNAVGEQYSLSESTRTVRELMDALLLVICHGPRRHAADADRSFR